MLGTKAFQKNQQIIVVQNNLKRKANKRSILKSSNNRSYAFLTHNTFTRWQKYRDNQTDREVEKTNNDPDPERHPDFNWLVAVRDWLHSF